MSIKNQVAVVTGSGRGVGAAIAINLAEKGVKVVLNYLNDEESVKEVQEKINEIGSDSIIVQSDVTTEEGANHIITESLKAFGTVDILVNNAGPLFKPMPIEDMTWEDMSRNLNEDMGAAFNMTKAVLDTMKQNHYGRIIYIGSLSSEKPSNSVAHHGSSRAAISTFAKYVAVEMSKHGITSNVVGPGMIETDRTKMQTKIIERLAEMTPAKRIAKPSDVARAVSFFANDDEGFYTGHEFPVSGGYHLK
ncbi:MULTISPECIES: SDR family oxidoreductase [unclassified Staphylococcus]|uniref:SDR family NAD(P)-dependent oxidoreductase n=1 Tax=unclassified Staphylococcus TaxID=91994 RepID=UPI001AEC1312|nr:MULTISPECIES: SDR family oxidoreductase [unclassified Staphylococcus]